MKWCPEELNTLLDLYSNQRLLTRYHLYSKPKLVLVSISLKSLISIPIPGLSKIVFFNTFKSTNSWFNFLSISSSIRGFSRKSIFAKKDIKKGELFSWSNLCIKRPGNGVSPMLIDEYLGKKSKFNYKTDDKIK